MRRYDKAQARVQIYEELLLIKLTRKLSKQAEGNMLLTVNWTARQFQSFYD
jgi:hypothetical protein